MTPRDIKKVLIIKVGYSETLDPEISDVTSYGDVLRSTVLVNLYKNDHLTWLVDEKAYPIVKNNKDINRVLIYNLTSVLQLQAEHFDTVINLEKVPGLCALADSIKAWQRFGFRFNVNTGQADAYDGSHVVMEICRDIEKKKREKLIGRKAFLIWLAKSGMEKNIVWDMNQKLKIFMILVLTMK